MAGMDEAVTIFETEDGVLLFGSESALASVDDDPGVVSRPISTTHLARVGAHAGAAAGALMEQSGRWVKLTSKSAKDLKAAKNVPGAVSDLAVLRKNGEFAKHLRFENLAKGAVLTPAAPAVLGAMATQYALEAALDDITAYLETIDLKLDQLLKQRKTETLGQIGGVGLAIDEAASIFHETGTVSQVTWSKVQATALALQTMQAEAVAHLQVVADNVAGTAGDVDKAAKALEQGQEDARFWLGVLARTIALQDRQYVLELARVAEEDEAQLDAHRRGITVARADRVGRIVAALEAISEAVTSAARLSNAAKVANPINAPRVTRQANDVSAAIAQFAEHADLEIREPGSLAATPWARAARGLLGEATSAVGSAGAGVAERAKDVGRAVEEKRDNRILRRARKIEEKRGEAE